MKDILTTYWIKLGETLNSQYGITAYSFEDAIYLLRETVFKKQEIPSVLSYTEGIRFEELDQNHIIPNMGPISERGIWFPNYF